MASPPQAHAEVQAAVSYFISHLSSLSLSDNDKASLSSSLTSSLQAKYDSHWHPTDPERGSAYRALTRSSSTLDDVLVSAFKAANIPFQHAAKALAASMACDKWTLWIDPGCVSIRMPGAANGGIQYNVNSLESPSTGAANNSKVTISGITEIWGKLPPSVVTSAGNVAVARPKTPAHTARKSKSIINLSSASKMLIQNTMSEEEEVAAEFEALALNASPAAKKSKAVAIMKPAAVHRGIASIASSENNTIATLATPPRPLPPLCFTIQESTSPYVPSFACAAAAVQVDNASTGSSAGNTIARGITSSMLASPPLYTSDSITSSCSSSSSSSASASDPFARPSSRSSTTSLGSATSCSIFSHASSDSRSSSIGSFTGSEEAEKENEAGNTTVTALNVAKASKGEMDAAKSFIFPGAEVSSKMTALKADTLALLPVASVPNSPSKSNTRRRHDRSASIISAASSSGSHTRSTSTRPSSRAEVRVDKETAKPQEYSNGKVGVLGGGVMLGPSKKDNNNNNNSHKRNHSTASSNNGHSSTLNIAKSNSRPGKPRTTSSGSITSNGSDYGYHHNQQQQQHSQYQQHYNAAYTHQQVGVYNNNWANYPPAPTQIPHQYRY